MLSLPTPCCSFALTHTVLVSLNTFSFRNGFHWVPLASTRAKTSDAQDTKAQAPEKTAAAAQPDVPAAEEATAAPTAVEPEATNELATEQVTVTSGDATSAHGTPTDPAVDLSGELYSKDAATTSAPAQGALDAPKKKRGFRAAWGAIRELLK